MSDFLTDAHIRKLTGLREKAAQIGWLKANGVRHFVNAAGKPVVPWSAIDAPGSNYTVTGWTPDFSQLPGA